MTASSARLYTRVDEIAAQLGDFEHHANSGQIVLANFPDYARVWAPLMNWLAGRGMEVFPPHEPTNAMECFGLSGKRMPVVVCANPALGWFEYDVRAASFFSSTGRQGRRPACYPTRSRKCEFTSVG